MDASENSTLKQAGLRITLPRLKILNVFLNSAERHLSAEDVYRLLISQEDERIGIATVYRVLTQFEQAGILVRHHFETGVAVFELDNAPHHDHICCVKCGKVEEFVDDIIEVQQSKMAEKLGYELHSHSLKMYGICGDCGQDAERS
ncbi:MAG: ferric iron uptake transcriptional regulator [Gammaproteobacteria bacterium AqS3]|nr:ferric iron uptake transcriptional regulator [Gammaproteobacteria bacterium AqS3]